MNDLNDKLKLSETEAKIIMYCKKPRTTKELLLSFNRRISYNHISQLVRGMNNLEKPILLKFKKGRDVYYYLNPEMIRITITEVHHILAPDQDPEVLEDHIKLLENEAKFF